MTSKKKMNRKERRNQMFGRHENSKVTDISSQRALKRPEVEIEALNDKQHEYLCSLYGDPCVICTGAAGTGKTFLAASVAAKDLSEKRIERIILSRANVATGKSLGAFPGTVEEKMAPWLLPITDVLRKQLGEGFYSHAVKTGTIQIQPLETIRGRSFDDAIVLMDEAQQLTKEELKAVCTRIGNNSKLFLMGDRAQRDVNTDGLKWLGNLVENHNLPISIHSFASEDIVRSGLCKTFVQAFEAEGEA
jgi:phosphate starvation-inducible PhoH-like protein